MILLDIGSSSGSSERKPYHDWKNGNWHDGGEQTAKLSDLAEFYENILLPRYDPATNSEETITVRL
jgi:hypothetical protein